MFSYEFYEIYKNSFSYITPPVTASISPKENTVFVKLFEIFFGSDILALFTKLSVKALIHLVLFECKLLKLTFKAVCYINNALILL